MRGCATSTGEVLVPGMYPRNTLDKNPPFHQNSVHNHSFAVTLQATRAAGSPSSEPACPPRPIWMDPSNVLQAPVPCLHPPAADPESQVTATICAAVRGCPRVLPSSFLSLTVASLASCPQTTPNPFLQLLHY